MFSSLRYFGALRDHEYVFVVDVSDPNFIYLQNEGPKPPTLQYMKRRARRILRHLSQKNPELYLQLALQLLREHGNRVLNAKTDWATMDVLFANSVRWEQTQSGHGPYTRIARQIILKRREERAPQIWDAHLDQARELLADANVPLEANEMALKVLRANGGDLSNRVLERAQLLRFLNSNLPLLQVFAARQLTQLLQSGEELSGSLWVFLMLRGNVQTRRLLEKHHSVDERWNNEATETLFGVLEQRQGKQKRRALKLLFERFQERTSDDVFWKHLEAFAGVSEPMHAWVLNRIQQTPARGDCARLTQLSTIRGKFGNEAIDAFFAGAANAQPSLEQAFSLVTTGNDDIGWRF